jgi:hypothetical protein
VARLLEEQYIGYFINGLKDGIWGKVWSMNTMHTRR